MNREEFAKILYLYDRGKYWREKDWIETVWAAIFDYWWKGYLNICAVYELYCSIIDIDSQTITIFEINSNIIIDILIEYGINLSNEHQEWIREGLDNSYYNKKYYISFYHETENSDSKYAFFFNEIFTELNEVIDYIGHKFSVYCDDEPSAIIKDNYDALEIYEIFQFEDCSDEEINRRKEVYIMFKGKHGEEMWNLMVEQFKIEDELFDLNKAIKEVQDELYAVNKDREELNKKILDYDHQCYMFEDIISKIEMICEYIENKFVSLGYKVDKLKRKKYIISCEKEFLEEKLMKIEDKKFTLNNQIFN